MVSFKEIIRVIFKINEIKADNYDFSTFIIWLCIDHGNVWGI